MLSKARRRELKRRWNLGMPEPVVSRPGARFYVTARSGTKARALLGPYTSHMTAQANVDRGRRLVAEQYPHDIEAAFASFGTASSPRTVRTAFGR